LLVLDDIYILPLNGDLLLTTYQVIMINDKTYKDEIIKLYENHTINEVIEIMKEKGFDHS
jgi:hypothetical protein